MKYGLLFLTLSILLLIAAISSGGLMWLLLWPALSLAVVASGYLGLGAKVFGKTSAGTIRVINFIVLFPYLITLWTLWHFARLFRRETPYHTLTENIIIGRRLMAHELPDEIEHVVDLTCEFIEPKPMRQLSYVSMPILDGASINPELLRESAEAVSRLSGKVYIHCAEGRGRTGLFAVAVLLALNPEWSVQEALEDALFKRPYLKLNRVQSDFLNQLDSLD